MSASKVGAVRQEPVASGREGEDPRLPFKWRMIYLFARLFFAQRNQVEEALKPHNLTPMQFTILATLGRWAGMSSAELSRRFAVTPQTMGEMIVNLERRSLVARVQDPKNRRALKLSLTEDGRRLVRVAEAALMDLEAQMFSDLSPEELDELQRQLLVLHDKLGVVVE